MNQNELESQQMQLKQVCNAVKKVQCNVGLNFMKLWKKKTLTPSPGVEVTCGWK